MTIKEEFIGETTYHQVYGHLVLTNELPDYILADLSSSPHHQNFIENVKTKPTTTSRDVASNVSSTGNAANGNAATSTDVASNVSNTGNGSGASPKKTKNS